MFLIPAPQQPPPLQVEVRPFSGLHVTVGDVPVIQGSAFAYFDAASGRGIYSSRWRPAVIEAMGGGRTRVRFDGDAGRVLGTCEFTRTESGVRARYEFRWRGERPAVVENSLGLIWAPSVAHGTAEIGGRRTIPLDPPAAFGSSLSGRAVAEPSGTFRFRPGWTSLDITTRPATATLADVRGMDVEWARGKDLLWLGYLVERVQPQGTVVHELEVRFTGTQAFRPGPKLETFPVTEPLRGAQVPGQTPMPLIPRAKSVAPVAGTTPIRDSFEFDGPPHLAGYLREMEEALWDRWRRSSYEAEPGATKITASVRGIGLPAEGYEVEVTAAGIRVTGQTELGVRHGFRTLVWLAKPVQGRLVWPRGKVRDWPSVGWRGVHAFGGPQARTYYFQLVPRVLGPLKFNRFVLECERTAWLATPGIAGPTFMTREDLRGIADTLRSHGIEPIPLVQSFGHAEWAFGNGRNLDLALNRAFPYTLDPRKKGTRDLLEAVWKEAVDLTGAHSVHFGLDEVDMRGVRDDPHFTTRLWQQHVPWLAGVARDLGARPMLWGDMALAAGEAPDATHGRTKAIASARRKAIPKSATVVDWHYADNPNPAAYKSIGLWQGAGMGVVAASWWRPNNVRGQALAAAEKGAGHLQTTWAGTTLDEAAIIREYAQFSAYVLAADYAWSGRQELPAALPYKPDDVLRRLYFAGQEAVSAVDGFSVFPGERTGKAARVDGLKVELCNATRLRSQFLPDPNDPSEVVLNLNRTAHEVALAIDASVWVGEDSALAEVSVQTQDGAVTRGTVRYGRHARQPRDRRSLFASGRDGDISLFRLNLTDDRAAKAVRQIRIRSLSPTAGLRIHGVTLL